MLYLVPTPIGNLSDITYRAVEVLKSVDYILAEDTRQSGKLMKEYGIVTPSFSFHIHNEHHKLPSIIEDLKSGKQIALVSDAGSPGISDPGYLLVRECVREDIDVSGLPGPTALITALITSGIPCDRFTFEGFLPHKKGRQSKWKEISERQETTVLYESPHRIKKCIKEAYTACGPGRQICIAREITKIHEEYIRGTVETVIKEIENRKNIKGEIVIILAGA
ncbi:16S rRNA (cytidine(1402)-2'-O)-methyltransferase [Membranihabitans maritimus]|uniref:16S rRNA (cytidine(1402)-2'-O)-methyltransferase n=1 Tax=Membranihabitans maritimus TaxID=2904244 RepID=UPI001F00F769|nr:16S rRNA (cytidine(1402)-2'-O)-methyltransferase [Membranihabitans maritimus]